MRVKGEGRRTWGSGGSSTKKVGPFKSGERQVNSPKEKRGCAGTLNIQGGMILKNWDKISTITKVTLLGKGALSK